MIKNLDIDDFRFTGNVLRYFKKDIRDIINNSDILNILEEKELLVNLELYHYEKKNF